MKDFSDDIAALRRRLDEAHTYLHIDELTAARPQLETEASRPDLWDDPDKAKKVNAELAAATDDLDLYAALDAGIDDAETLFELGREEADDSVEAEVADALDELRSRFDELELRALFTGDLRDMLDIVEQGRPAGMHVRREVGHEIDADDTTLVGDRADRGVGHVTRMIVKRP